MNKKEYLEELKFRLQGVSKEEMEDALHYCEEYLDEAGDENIDQAIEELGSPAKFAAQVKAESAIRTVQCNENTCHTRSSVHSFWTIFLGICALPIALPFALLAVILVFTMGLVGVVLLIAFSIVVIALTFCALPLIFSGLFLPLGANTLIRMGSGFFLIAFGILTLIVIYHIIRTFLPWCTNGITRLYHKAKGGSAHA